MIEYLNAPTPFLYGIHTDYRHLLPDLYDVFVVDLDGGSVACPENLPVPQLPEPYFNEVVESLFQILSPELLTADHVYPPKPQNPSRDLVVQDKQLRAVFIRLFASLFAGYRSCLSITRIHPQPVIHFNQTWIDRKVRLIPRGKCVHHPPRFRVGLEKPNWDTLHCSNLSTKLCDQLIEQLLCGRAPSIAEATEQFLHSVGCGRCTQNLDWCIYPFEITLGYDFVAERELNYRGGHHSMFAVT
ncbi:unnamed protein product [Echinostoma caproni]|uniref:UDENN domain-containing protein n=1 Tax=Echinostoma caproni TaxID=27848 RepID=A0A3P8JQM6_9TREM|nr:unnamed protein product [Echinostoma caproni]